ncbi:MAG: MerC domain-containing protein [Gammaproteobacteria bacterium]|nr:MerC domain-containing protein [Gammaproteobacteria bacterium]
MINLTRHSFIFDKFAVSTSALCAIHCLFLPIALSLFPALGTTIFGQESFHKWLLFLVIPLSLVALTMGCKQHKSWLVAILGLIGISILIFTAVYGHDVLGHDRERIATLIGVSVIALGHMLNYKLCRRVNCET